MTRSDSKKPPVHRPACGTAAGYQAHMRASEYGCGPCAEARSDYVLRWRVATGSTTVLYVPFELLGRLLARAPERLRQEAAEMLGEVKVRAALDAAAGSLP